MKKGLIHLGILLAFILVLAVIVSVTTFAQKAEPTRALDHVRWKLCDKNSNLHWCKKPWSSPQPRPTPTPTPTIPSPTPTPKPSSTPIPTPLGTMSISFECSSNSPDSRVLGTVSWTPLQDYSGMYTVFYRPSNSDNNWSYFSRGSGTTSERQYDDYYLAPNAYYDFQVIGPTTYIVAQITNQLTPACGLP